MVISSLYAISYTSISSSFHQFITNPTTKELNYTDGSVSDTYVAMHVFTTLKFTRVISMSKLL